MWLSKMGVYFDIQSMKTGRDGEFQVKGSLGSLGVFCGLYGVNWFEGILSVGQMKKMGYMEKMWSC